MGSGCESAGEARTPEDGAMAEGGPEVVAAAPAPVVDLTEPKASGRRFYANLSDL